MSDSLAVPVDSQGYSIPPKLTSSSLTFTKPDIDINAHDKHLSREFSSVIASSPYYTHLESRFVHHHSSRFRFRTVIVFVIIALVHALNQPNESAIGTTLRDVFVLIVPSFLKSLSLFSSSYFVSLSLLFLIPFRLLSSLILSLYIQSDIAIVLCFMLITFNHSKIKTTKRFNVLLQMCIFLSHVCFGIFRFNVNSSEQSNQGMMSMFVIVSHTYDALFYTLFVTLLLTTVRPLYRNYIRITGFLGIFILLVQILSIRSFWQTLALPFVFLVVSIVFILSSILVYALETDSRMSWWTKDALRSRGCLHLAQRNQQEPCLLPFITKQKYDKIDENVTGLLDSISSVAFTPVFITGLHRSGTTFLYDKLCELTQVARVRPYDILYFRRLLHSKKIARIDDKEVAALSEYFKAVGLRDRLIDRVPLSALNPCEEYCFILMNNLSQWLPASFSPKALWQWLEAIAKINKVNEATTTLMCKKLVVTQNPINDIVLLKNPYDYGNEAEILKYFPNAKFIHISRDPVHILASTNVAVIHHVSMDRLDSYFWLFLNPLSKYLLSLERIVWTINGRVSGSRRLLDKSVDRQVEIYGVAAQSLASIPKHQIIHVTYKDLINDTPGELGRCLSFLNLSSTVDKSLLEKQKSSERPFKPTAELLARLPAISRSFDSIGIVSEYLIEQSRQSHAQGQDHDGSVNSMTATASMASSTASGSEIRDDDVAMRG